MDAMEKGSVIAANVNAANIVLMWLAIGEGAEITWADYGGHYRQCFFWSANLRGERVVECTYKARSLLADKR